MGAELSIAARNVESLAMAQAMGFKACPYTRLEAFMGDFDFIINTVPERVITDAMLCLCESGTLILELASGPGGFNKNLAENIGLKLVTAPGLPGKSAPYTAAVLMKAAIYRAIRDMEE